MFTEDPLSVLRLVKSLCSYPDYTMDDALKDILLKTDLAACFRKFLMGKDKNSPAEGRLSTALESLFAPRFNMLKSIRKMNDLGVIASLTGLVPGDIMNTLILLSPITSADSSYCKRKAFYYYLYAHFCEKNKPDLLALKQWPLYGTCHCLKEVDKKFLQAIEYELLGIGSKMLSPEPYLVAMILGIKVHYQPKPQALAYKVSQSLSQTLYGKTAIHFKPGCNPVAPVFKNDVTL